MTKVNSSQKALITDATKETATELLEILSEEITESLDRNSLSRFIFRKKSKISDLQVNSTLLFPVDFRKGVWDPDTFEALYTKAFTLFQEREHNEALKILKFLKKVTFRFEIFTLESLDEALNTVETENKLIILSKNLFFKLEQYEHNEFLVLCDATENPLKRWENPTITYRGFEIWSDLFSNESIIKPNEFFIVAKDEIGFIETEETYNDIGIISDLKIQIPEPSKVIQVVGGEFSAEE